MTARQTIFWGAAGTTLLTLALGAACGGSASSGSPSYGGFAGKSGSFGTGGALGFAGGATGSARGGASGTPLPAEQEVDSSFEVPVATGRYVWVANPSSGRVAFIDASTLAVKTAEAGNEPTALATVPGATDTVIVLNSRSHDATLMQASVAGQLTTTMIGDVAPLANAWAVSPNGRVAIAWTNSALDAAKRKSTLEGFQDLTVIDLGARPPVATTLAVGYRPTSVTFSTDATQAFVVTGDGISVLALPPAASAVSVAREIALGTDPAETADSRDVTVTPAGRAVVRRDGAPELRLVDLSTAAITTIPLSGPATDVDVTADGARAVAIVRDTAELVIIPLGAPSPSSVLRETIDGEVVGSVVLTADATKAVLFSNATDAERLTVVDLASGTYRILPVHAPVLSVQPSPDGQYAVVVHRAAATTPTTSGAGGGPGTPVSPANAFSVVPLDGSRSGRITATVAPPNAVAIAPASDRALVTVRDDQGKVFGAYVVGIPALDVTSITLASPPIATGVAAAANRGFVAQSHPEGRITFIPFAGGEPHTLTGFDLAARVVDGATP